MTEGERVSGVAKACNPGKKGPETPEASHAKVKGSSEEDGVVRASTGLAATRERKWMEAGRVPIPQDNVHESNRGPVCETHDPTGEPDAGKLHVRFGERGLET